MLTHIANPVATITVANSTTVSSAVDLNGMTLCGFITPAALTGTAITFQMSSDGVTYVAVNKDGAALSVVVTTSKYIVVNPADFAGARFIKLVSGSAEGADRVLTLCVRPVQ